ncbi:MAG: TIGR02099 family protein [Bdellovibrionales bacterium]|nr:TIGR02099 family protein [Ramlibacter sp.]
MTDALPSPNRLLRSIAIALRWMFKGLLVGLLAFTAAWGALHLWIVPRIGEFRAQLETQASKVLGVPVRIGAITAQSEGLIPSFELINVALLDPQGREALMLPRVLASLSPRSVWNLGFDQLYLDRPALDVRRAGGKIYVAGLDLTHEGANDGRAADWFFSQTEIAIHQGTLRWTDEQRAAPPLTLTQVDVVLRNTTRRHGMRIDATPPPGWGERFSLRGLFRQPLLSTRSGFWQEWDGQLYAEFPRLDVSQLRRYADVGVNVTEGNGAVRAWADVDNGQLVGGTADVALAEVSATLGAQLQPLALQSVAGRMGGRRLAGGFEFTTQGLQFQTQEGLRWPGGNVFVRWTEAQGNAPAQGQLRADRLDLAALAQVANRLPLGTSTHAALLAYGPKGLVNSVEASWKGPLSAPQQYMAKGRISQLELAARHGGVRPETNPPREAVGSPGIKGADIEFDLTQAGGKLKLAVNKGALDLPGVFAESLVPFELLQADANWQIDGEKIRVDLPAIKFANADFAGEAHASWRTSEPAQSSGHGRFPGVLDLQGSMSRAAGTRVYRYLPLSIGASVRQYVQNAVVKGDATGVKFRVKGDLHDMPFADPKRGDFRISGKISDATLAYVPRSIQPPGAREWPALTQLSGELIFERQGMRVEGGISRMAGAPGLLFNKVGMEIPDLARTTVLVRADGRGPLSEALAVVMGSPLGVMAGPVLEKTTANGVAGYQLLLNLPVANIAQSRVQGSVTLAGNDLQISPAAPQLGRARGLVTFSETGFGVSNGQARMLGGDVRIDGGTRTGPGNPGETSTMLRAQGQFTADGLKQAREMGFVSRLAQNMSGGASYAAVLGVRRGVPELMITSNLQGLALNLPAPLNKPADSVMPLRFENTLVRESLSATPAGPQKLMDQLLLDIGRVVSVSYIRDVSGADARVLRGGIAVGLLPGESAPAPQEGVVANVNLASINLDAWETVLTGAAGASISGAAVEAPRAAPAPGAAAAAGAIAAAPAAAGSGAASSYLPTSMAIRARELTLQGRTLHNVVVGGSREGLNWRANLDATELNGYLEYRQATGAGAGRVYARLARLTIAPGGATDVEALLNEQPANIPALDIIVDELELRGRKMGRLEIDAVNRGAGAVAREGGVREWRLNKLNFTLPEAAFTASGNWAAVNAVSAAPGGPRPGRPATEARRTVMNFKLDINDSGALLARFGMKDVIRRGKGKMEGRVAWTGSPLSLDYPTLDGNFNVNIESGQFLKADPGLAKLLGVLSLQALPRRLALDFRDVFTEGFAFDFVRGDVTIEDGIAATNNLQMKGVNAAVLMEGRADIAKETQDIKVVVVPEINAGTASLVATVINPAIGIGTFLAQVLLRRPLIAANTQEFHIDGTWADPRITKVQRRVAAQPPAGSDGKPGVTQ